jgi:hypothetical protein
MPSVSSTSLRSISARALAAGAAALAAACLVLSPAPAHAALGWFSGTSQYQQGPQCFGGPTGYGINTDTSVSYWTDPDAGYPAVGDRYLMRILVGVVGFSCSGGISDFNTELLLPGYTALSIDLASANPVDKVRCFYESSKGVVTEVTDKTWTYPGDTSIKGKWCDSTKLPTMGTYGYALGSRMAEQGAMFWVDVPVVSFKRLAGMGGSGYSSTMGAAISSGINTFTNPTQWVTVFDRPAAVSYPADATSAVTDTTVRTKAVLDAWYRKGNVYVDLGTGASGDYQVSAGPIAIDGNWANYTVTQDWGQLTPGTDHHWRLRFVDEQGATTVGAPQTFKTTGTAPSGGGTVPKPSPGGGSTGTGGTGTGASAGAGGTGNVPTGTTTSTTTPAGATTGSTATQGGGATPAPAPAASAPIPAPPTGGRAALAPGTRLAALTRGGAKVRVPCVKACRAVVSLKVDAATARRLGLGRKATVLATGRATTTTAKTVVVTLKARGRAAKALRRAKALTATLTVAVDGTAPQTLKVTLKK